MSPPESLLTAAAAYLACFSLDLHLVPRSRVPVSPRPRPPACGGLHSPVGHLVSAPRVRCPGGRSTAANVLANMPPRSSPLRRRELAKHITRCEEGSEMKISGRMKVSAAFLPPQVLERRPDAADAVVHR